jgi:2-iminobutanoate/2-iminopropanoate deaminase
MKMVNLLIPLVLAIILGSAVGCKREIIQDPAATALASGLFSAAIKCGDLIYVSGNIGRDSATGQLCPGGIRNETLCTFRNIERVLNAAGAGLEDILDVTVFVGQPFDEISAGLNVAYAEVFPTNPPARSAFGAVGLAAGAAAEFKVLATVPSKGPN